MAFRYPDKPHVRRHGPRGYRTYRAYKPWLRDEFDFRCVYCLWRERWCADGDQPFSVDHLLPQTTHSDHIYDYDNLVYACSQCNAFKQAARVVVNPCEDAPDHHLEVNNDGRVHALTAQGDEHIALCRLNRPRLLEARLMMIELLSMLAESPREDARDLLQFLQGFPDNLPRLSALKPPGGNRRPDAIVHSYYDMRRRGELPASY